MLKLLRNKPLNIIPSFRIDLDIPAYKRYDQVFDYFKQPLIDMVKLFQGQVPIKYQEFMEQNISKLQKNNRCVYEFSQCLAEKTGFKIPSVSLINSITSVVSYCTSIIVKKPNGQFLHGRTLDFANSFLMQKLIYEAVYTKQGKVIFKAPSIAGFYGMYTGIKNDCYSLSYNCRFTKTKSDEEVYINMQNLVDGVPMFGQMIQQGVIETDNFNDLVKYISNHKADCTGYVTIAGKNQGEAVIIAHDRNKSVNARYIQNNAYLVQTNSDCWNESNENISDKLRNSDTLHILESSKKFQIDEQMLMYNVLRSNNVTCDITLFAVVMDPAEGVYYFDNNENIKEEIPPKNYF